MIYEAVHDIFTLLIVDVSLLPLEFQYLVYFAEMLLCLTFLKVLLYPFRMVMAFMYGTGRALFPRQFNAPRRRSFRTDDDE